MRLLSPLDVGPLRLPNRVVLAPMTRSRHPDGVPNGLAPAYYAERASAGLVITEATQVSPRGVGYPLTPGLHEDAHVEGWRAVTDLVHAVGGRVFSQLWHVGRVSHPAYHGGEKPWSASAVGYEGQQMLPDFSMADVVEPHAMTAGEVAQTVAEFRAAAERAKGAGFDGVEVHGANGYLVEQFLAPNVNRRGDEFGGSAQNRVRFPLQVVEAAAEVWGPERVGIRLSPGTDFAGMGGMPGDETTETYALLAERLSDYGLAYVHVMRTREFDLGGETTDAPGLVRRHFRGVLFAAGGFDRDAGEAYLADGRADAIAYGRAFLANPDLPIRFAQGAPLNEPDPGTFYGGTHVGYTDYPAWDGAGRLDPLAPDADGADDASGAASGDGQADAEPDLAVAS